MWVLDPESGLCAGNSSKPAQPNSSFLITLALAHVKDERLYFQINVN